MSKRIKMMLKNLMSVAFLIIALVILLFLYINSDTLEKTITKDIFLAISTTLLVTSIVSLYEQFFSIDIPTEVEQALQPYSKMKDIGITNVCGSSENRDELKVKISHAKRIRCMSRTGKDFLENFGDEIFALAKANLEASIEIIICSEEAAKDPYMKKVCPGSYPYLDIISFYKQYQSKSNFNIKNIIIKEYEFVLTGNVLIVDDYFRFIPYLPEKHSKNSIAIWGNKVATDRNGLFETFNDIFEEIWENRSSINMGTMNERITIQDNVLEKSKFCQHEGSTVN